LKGFTSLKKPHIISQNGKLGRNREELTHAQGIRRVPGNARPSRRGKRTRKHGGSKGEDQEKDDKLGKGKQRSIPKIANGEREKGSYQKPKKMNFEPEKPSLLLRKMGLQE